MTRAASQSQAVGMDAWPERVRGLVLVSVLSLAAVTTACQPKPDAQPVIGGSAPPLADYPYFVMVGEKTDPYLPFPTLCDGSVIAAAWVLTAAHCIDPSRPTIRVQTLQGTTYGTWFTHPLWNGKVDEGHDVAVIQVDAAVTAGITPIQAGDPWNPGSYAAGTRALVMGTGTKHDPNVAPNQFRVAETTLRDDNYMSQVLSGHWKYDMMIGAGSPTATTCDGDSGSPLVALPANRPAVQVGVASFGPPTCDTAAAFAQLDAGQLAWIASKVPGINEAWGYCTNSVGIAGRGFADYGTDAFYGPWRDGSYFWDIRCQAANARLFQVRLSGLCANENSPWLDGDSALTQGSCTAHPNNIIQLDPLDTGYYRLVVAANDSCLGVAGDSQTLRAHIQGYRCSADQGQQWSLRPTDSGYYEIVARHSGLCMDVEGDKLTPGALIWQYTCDQGYNQQFGFLAAAPCPDAPNGPPALPLATLCLPKKAAK